MERLSDHNFELIDGERVALVYIQGAEQYQMALRQAARRIRCNVRSSDIVLLPGSSCAIVLPDTLLEGAQAVVRRISPLLADIEYELQMLYGSAAYALLQQLQEEQVVIVEQKEREPVYVTSLVTPPMALSIAGREPEPLPYLAFLAHYPSQRLLHLFPYELACRYHCIPVGAERRVLTLATSQELGHEVIAYFQQVIQRNIFQVRCDASMINDVLNYWQRTMLA